MVGAIESVKSGTTTLVDHHASPNFVHNSLDIIKDAMSRVGIRGVLCYETTDRGGMRRRDLGLEENERFLTENTNNSHFRGVIGAHAGLTLVDESLKRLGDLAETYDTGVHIHVGEDKADVMDSQKRYRLGVVDRLDKFGIVRKKSIFAHGVHLTERELSKVDRSGAWVVHNPRSNMNNRVGYAPLKWFGKRSALGTDGFPSDMLEETKIGYFRNVDSEARTEFSRLPSMVQNGNELVSEFFGRTFGTIAKGSPADIVVLDYVPSTPMHTRNLQGHFLFGMNTSSVQHVMIDGSWVVWDRQLVGIEEQAVMVRAGKVASKLWKRMNG
jgi:cytosine/adenosine deaminase-related metal-dependent hydrolase